MKKIKFGVVESLGYLGIFIWIAVILLRDMRVSSNSVYLFVIGILPNLGAAWLATMFGKWIILLGFKQTMTFKKYALLCLSIVLLALTSEVIHDLFLNSSFDVNDILITVLAQSVIFFLPVLMGDKYLYSYD